MNIHFCGYVKQIEIVSKNILKIIIINPVNHEQLKKSCKLMVNKSEIQKNIQLLKNTAN